FEKFVRFLFCTLQPFEMRDRLRALQHKSKRCRDLFRPILNDLWGRKSAKSIVNFDRGKSLGVISEHLLLGNFLRVETPFPLRVTVPTCADQKSQSIYRHGKNAPKTTAPVISKGSIVADRNRNSGTPKESSRTTASHPPTHGTDIVVLRPPTST